MSHQPLKVGLVATCLNCEHIRGMGKYLYELTAQSRADAHLQWVAMGNDRRFGMTLPPDLAAEADVFEQRGDRFHLWEQWGLPRRAKHHGLDLLHCTENTLPLWQPVPTVVTVHDTLPWEAPTEPFYWNNLLPLAMRRCAHVVTISDCSRDDILARWPWLADKLTVIPHGIDARFFDARTPAGHAGLNAALGASPYAVYMGGPMQRKRFDWALEVMQAQADPALKLVACGFGAVARAQSQAEVPAALADRVVFAEFLSDEELIALYKGARAVLYPTLYEGFGFPAVEAQAAGVPVIFSPLGSLKELIGPLASVVPAPDLQAWAQALNVAQALSPEARQNLAVQARAWAQRFQWSASYERHLEVYQRIARRTPA